MGLFFALSLRGQAQAVFGDLPRDRGQQYETVLRSLQERFSTPNQTELYRVQRKERQQKVTETLSELGQAPTAPGKSRKLWQKTSLLMP